MLDHDLFLSVHIIHEYSQDVQKTTTLKTCYSYNNYYYTVTIRLLFSGKGGMLKGDNIEGAVGIVEGEVGRVVAGARGAGKVEGGRCSRVSAEGEGPGGRWLCVCV